MNRDYGSNMRFTTSCVDDKEKGYAGVELYCTSSGERKRVARVIFWDASGQFFIETFNSDLPLVIVEELIAEAKATVKTR